jgi:hypothetical protein
MKIPGLSVVITIIVYYNTSWLPAGNTAINPFSWQYGYQPVQCSPNLYYSILQTGPPDSHIAFYQALKYRSVTDIVRPIRQIVRRREETTGHSVRPK